MALHIADKEVSDLVTAYARTAGMSKTEALRRIMREAVHKQRRAASKDRFRTTAGEIIKSSRAMKVPPFTRAEADALFE